LQCGIMLLDASRRPLFANSAMGTVIGGDLKLVDGRLVADGPCRDVFYAACKAAIGEGVGDGAVAPRALMLADGRGGRFAVYVHPASGSRLPAGGNLALLGLTLGEARVASHVAAGRTPRESAIDLGVSEETTRTVLKRVFAKVGVSRQSELAALIARMAPGGKS
jgi:DNA-binding CsgD family transcriptional regulator